MKIYKHLSSLIAVVILSLATMAAQAEEYSFKVNNTTNSKIVKLLVSEDGEEWGYFDIGIGIPAGASDTLVWDQSTNDEECKQYFKAEFADGEESEEVIFNFCEEDLELEF